MTDRRDPARGRSAAEDLFDLGGPDPDHVDPEDTHRHHRGGDLEHAEDAYTDGEYVEYVDEHGDVHHVHPDDLPADLIDGPGLDEHFDAAASEIRGGRHRTGAPTKPRRVGRGPKRVVVPLLVLVLVVTAAVAAVSFLKPMFSGIGGSNDYPGPGAGAVQVVVKQGDTGRAIGATLEAAGVVKSAKAFSDAAAANPDSAGIQPGTYSMLKEMRAADAVAFLANTANRQVKRVTLREGLWKSETFAALSQATGLPVADYVTAAKDTAALGLPAAAKGNIEGYLFPSSYEFPPQSTAADQLRTMVQKCVAELTRLGITPARMERTMIIASIVEAEGRFPQDRPKIARVLENRLAKPMRLQLDTTVSYGVQKRKLTTTPAERALDNGYSTYARDGLPKGPISNPGAAAIGAATHPTPGPWLYFVAVNPDTGETKFATTSAEHDQNVQQFQDWCSQNKGKCAS